MSKKICNFSLTPPTTPDHTSHASQSQTLDLCSQLDRSSFAEVYVVARRYILWWCEMFMKYSCYFLALQCSRNGESKKLLCCCIWWRTKTVQHFVTLLSHSRSFTFSLSLIQSFSKSVVKSGLLGKKESNKSKMFSGKYFFTDVLFTFHL